MAKGVIRPQDYRGVGRVMLVLLEFPLVAARENLDLQTSRVGLPKYSRDAVPRLAATQWLTTLAFAKALL